MNRKWFYAVIACLPALSLAAPVDINHADAATLSKELKGVGPAKAQAIVQYREKNGAFKNADDLARVKGIGPKGVEINRSNIRLAAVEASKKP